MKKKILKLLCTLLLSSFVFLFPGLCKAEASSISSSIEWDDFSDAMISTMEESFFEAAEFLFYSGPEFDRMEYSANGVEEKIFTYDGYKFYIARSHEQWSVSYTASILPEKGGKGCILYVGGDEYNAWYDVTALDCKDGNVTGRFEATEYYVSYANWESNVLWTCKGEMKYGLANGKVEYTSSDGKNGYATFSKGKIDKCTLTQNSMGNYYCSYVGVSKYLCAAESKNPKDAYFYLSTKGLDYFFVDDSYEYPEAEYKRLFSLSSLPPIIPKTIYLNDVKETKGYTASAEYLDSYFSQANSEKLAKKGLAKLSALVALSTYQKNKNSTTNILENCGFSDVSGRMFSADKINTSKKSSWKSSKKHSTRTDNDHAVFYIGHKEINGVEVIAVAINGYSAGGYEWISNFELGLSKTHTGFNMAAVEICNWIKKYIDDYNLTEKPKKLWVTGHSRGAALTNLVAIKMTKQKGNYKIDTNNVYAYGFATPRYTQNNVPKSYANCILNYINYGDFVPFVAPEKWGYKRYGTDIYFSDSKVKKVKSTYKKVVGRAYEGNSKIKCQELVYSFVRLGKSQKKYTHPRLSLTKGVIMSAKEYAQQGIGYAMSENVGTQILGVTTMLSCSAADADAAMLTAKLVNDSAISNGIKDAHSMITYYLLIDALY